MEGDARISLESCLPPLLWQLENSKDFFLQEKIPVLINRNEILEVVCAKSIPFSSPIDDVPTIFEF